MNAVNLLPAGAARRSRAGLSVSRPFLGLVAGLGAVLLATVLYVSAHDRVSSRQAELRHLQTATAGWTAAAASFNPSVAAFGEREKTIATVRALAAQRYDWSTLLTQIAGRLPAHAALSSLDATAPTAADAVSATTAGATGTTPSTDGIQLSGCATSQPVVAATMTALRRITGVSQVTLGSSGKDGAGATTGGGACSLPVQFTITLAFAAPTDATSAPSAGTAVGTEAGDTEPAR